MTSKPRPTTAILDDISAISTVAGTREWIRSRRDDTAQESSEVVSEQQTGALSQGDIDEAEKRVDVIRMIASTLTTLRDGTSYPLELNDAGIHALGQETASCRLLLGRLKGGDDWRTQRPIFTNVGHDRVICASTGKQVGSGTVSKIFQAGLRLASVLTGGEVQREAWSAIEADSAYSRYFYRKPNDSIESAHESVIDGIGGVLTQLELAYVSSSMRLPGHEDLREFYWIGRDAGLEGLLLAEREQRLINEEDEREGMNQGA